MKNKVLIMTDSNSGITQAEGKDLGLFVIPMPFFIDGKEFLEDITLTQDGFYEYLKNNAEISTSQPSLFYLEETWDNCLKEYDSILYIPMSSGLSKTCENAMSLAENNTKFKGKVFVVDNKRISVTMKESVFEALQLVKEGKSAKEIREYLLKTRDKASVYIMVDTLKYLKKGGRIKPAAALIGELLKLKPVLYSDGGSFDRVATPRTLKQAKIAMLECVKKDLETKFKEEYEKGQMTISVAHTENFAEAEIFKNEIKEMFPLLRFHFVDSLSLSVSCHIGSGALATAMSINTVNKD